MIGNLDVERLVDQAVEHLRSHAFKPAMELLHQVLADDPTHADANFLMSQILIAQDDRLAALVYLEACVATDPTRAEAHNWIGIIRMNAGEGEAAEQSLMQAITYNPVGVNAMLNLARLYLNQSRAGNALPQIDHALELDASDAEMHLLRGDALRDLRRGDEAADAYQSALDRDPKLFEARFQLAKILNSLNRLDDAHDKLQECARHQPGNELVDRELGTVLIKLGRYAEGMALHERSTGYIEFDPQGNAGFRIVRGPAARQ